MAGENLTTNLEHLTEVGSGVVLLSLADRAVVGDHPAVLNLGPMNLMQSKQSQGRLAAIEGANLYTSRTEIESEANTVITMDDFDVAVGRLSLTRAASGTAYDQDGMLTSEMYVRDLVRSGLVTETNLLAALSTSFTNITGDVSTDMSLVTFLSALTALEARDVPGPYLFLGHTAHFAGLRLDQLLSVGGQMQYQAPSAVGSAVGNMGQLFGVDMFKTNRAPTSTTGRAGMMAGAGAILRNHQNPSITNTGEQIAIGNIKIYDTYEGRTDVKVWGGHLYTGYKIQNADGDTRGQQIRCRGV